MSDKELCDAHSVSIHQVGEVYVHDQSGRLLSEAEKLKWFVGVRVDDYPDETIRAIPLADTEEEAMANAVKYLGLRAETGNLMAEHFSPNFQIVCPECQADVEPHRFTTPMWKAILFPALAITAFLVGALQLDGVLDTGLEVTGPAFVVAGAIVVVGLVPMAMSYKDKIGFYCRNCGYSE